MSTCRTQIQKLGLHVPICRRYVARVTAFPGKCREMSETPTNEIVGKCRKECLDMYGMSRHDRTVTATGCADIRYYRTVSKQPTNAAPPRLSSRQARPDCTRLQCLFQLWFKYILILPVNEFAHFLKSCLHRNPATRNVKVARFLATMTRCAATTQARDATVRAVALDIIYEAAAEETAELSAEVAATCLSQLRSSHLPESGGLRDRDQPNVFV
eukprot:scaffold40918_cov70-Phaeocystis_antarctica.AAC.3